MIASLASPELAILASEMRGALALVRAPILRPISRWVEEEIILPSGQYAGQRYRHHRHPVSRPWFEARDRDLFSRYAFTGPTQCGKTLMGYVLPVLYHLFEIGETVIIGIPNMDMANDKWQQDFLPTIEASRYRSYLPARGEGSRGGQVKRSIAFTNGAVLRFMSGGGNDKKRAGYTSRVVAITETDGMDTSGEASREADKIEQLEGRTRAYGRTEKRIYLECTVSIERGRIWQELINGTDSRIARPCPHCGEYVVPERVHLRGWEHADSEEQAAQLARWHCPACEVAWRDEERRAAAERGVLVHRGQKVSLDGEIVGEAPQTQTMSFRFSAIDNPFATAGDLGAEEWLAKRAADRENAERKMKQFVFVIPDEPPEINLTPLEPADVRARFALTKKGVLPSGTIGISVAVDTGLKALHWEAKAIVPQEDCESLVVIDYGVHKVDAANLGAHRGLTKAFGELSAYLEAGWGGMRPSQVWIDSGYHEHTNAVYDFCEKMNAGLERGSERYRPIKGYGEGQQSGESQRIGPYLPPEHRGKDILYIGREYHIARLRRNGRLVPGVLLVHVNADVWKSEVHQRLAMPTGDDKKYPPGAISLYYSADPTEHSDYADHITAERKIEKTITKGKPPVTTFERIRRANHHLDTAYISTAAADFIARMLRSKPQQTTGNWFGAQQSRSQGGRWR